MANWRERAIEAAEAARKRAADLDLDFDLDLAQLRREQEAESSGFISGFALGVIVGVILALIFAPMRGEQTRELVAERAVHLKDRATDLVAQVRGEEEAPSEAAGSAEAADSAS